MRDYFDLSDVQSERRAKILGCFLEGPPAVTYRKADDAMRNDIEKIFDLLKAKYGNGTRHYTSTTKATSRVQLTEESVSDYYADCIKLYGRISLNHAATQCSLFVQGLKPEVRDKIGYGRFETIEDAMI